MTVVDELLDSIFDGRQTGLYPQFAGWVRGSRRFRAFAAEHRVKIRSKLKRVSGESGMRDLAAELETAHLLLTDERFTLEYEKYAASKQRGPDFTVTFRTHTPFNVEVRRVGSLELDERDAEARAGKLVEVLCDKAGQMPAGIVNLLWLAAEREIPEADLARAAAVLRQLAEHKAEAFFVRRGFDSAAEFLKRYSRLSGVVLHRPDGYLLWLNPLARHYVPREIATAIRKLGGNAHL